MPTFLSILLFSLSSLSLRLYPTCLPSPPGLVDLGESEQNLKWSSYRETKFILARGFGGFVPRLIDPVDLGPVARQGTKQVSEKNHPSHDRSATMRCPHFYPLVLSKMQSVTQRPLARTTASFPQSPCRASPCHTQLQRYLRYCRNTCGKGLYLRKKGSRPSCLLGSYVCKV